MLSRLRERTDAEQPYGILLNGLGRAPPGNTHVHRKLS